MKTTIKRAALAILGVFIFAACTREDIKEESRYYVRYAGETSTLHIVETRYNIASDSGDQGYRSKGFTSEYSVTIGPVKKGFKASITCECDEEEQWIKNQRVTIEVSKDGEPFALKKSGANRATYIIDY